MKRRFFSALFNESLTRNYSSSIERIKCDSLIIGGGIVGLAIGNALVEDTSRNIMLLEKNSQFGQETTSRNSEVIHAGIYHHENMLKSHLCQEGNRLLYAYCKSRGIPYSNCGKIVVANDEEQMNDLLHIMDTHQNLDLKPLSFSEMNHLEPLIKGHAGMYSPHTGIVDSHALVQCMVHELQDFENINIATNHKVEFIEHNSHFNHYSVTVSAAGESFIIETPSIINAAGLHAEHVLHSTNLPINHSIPKLVYVKGQYYSCPSNLNISHLIYPMPTKHLKGLGTHLTMDLAGNIKFGPDVHVIGDAQHYHDQLDSLYTVKADSIEQVKASIASYLSIDVSKITPNDAGIRPKLVDTTNAICDFFVKVIHPGFIHLTGIESPGLTSSLAIGQYVHRLLTK